jgi:glycosyltransferase involved in cell wall biosynthesis
MPTPDFTVVIPAYNAASTIDRCLNALMHQTVERERYEVIVVDDGSTDDTAERASRWGARVIRQANAGPAAARNRGATEAQGTLLLFTDADCEPTAQWLAEMTRVFDSPEVMAAKGSYKTKQRSLAARFAQLEFEERYDQLEQHASIDMIDTYSAAYRTETFHKLGGFDPVFPMANGEDLDLSYRLAATGARMVFARRAVVYHQHPDSLRRYIRVKYTRGYWRMLVYTRYTGKILKDTYTPQTLKLQSALIGLVALGVPVGLASVLWSQILILGGLLGVFATAVPFALRYYRLDPIAAALSPGFLFARATAIGLGAFVGAFAHGNSLFETLARQRRERRLAGSAARARRAA